MYNSNMPLRGQRTAKNKKNNKKQQTPPPVKKNK